MKMLMNKMCCTKNADLGLLALRLAVGIPFVAHGAQKLMNLDATMGFFQTLGMPGFMGGVIGVIELVAGLALVLGMATALAGYLLAAVMVVAIVLVKKNMGFFGGYELDLVLLLAALAVANLGCGSYSMCAMRKGKGGMMMEAGCCGGGCCGEEAAPAAHDHDNHDGHKH